MWGTVQNTRGRVRHLLAQETVLAGMLLPVCPCVFALDPALDVSQYAHTSWKIREGFSKGPIYAIAQTPDGYLWLGTEFGLLRFDGVRTVPFQPPPDQHLPSNFITGLLAARDGALWIGTVQGLASWKDGKLTQYPELAGQNAYKLLEDRDGMVWAGGFGIPTGRLCAIQSQSVHCYGQDGTLGVGVSGSYEDSRGNLWIGVRDGLWRWKPGLSNFYPMPDNEDAIRAFGEDENGALLISTRTGIKRFVEGKPEPSPLPDSVQHLRVESLLRDRDGALWIGAYGQGLVHVHHGRTDVFGQSDNLSGGKVFAFLEDREGNIWVATDGGLDRFRDFAVTTISAHQSLLDPAVVSVLADRDGSVWLSTGGGLNRWDREQVTIADTGGAKRDGRLNGDIANSLFQDSRGRVWVSTAHGFGYVKNGRFVPIGSIPGRIVCSIAEDAAGNLWIANQYHGLFRFSQRGEVEQIPWAGLGHEDFATALIAEPLHGGLWLGFFKGGVAYFSDGGVRASYAAANGLGEGRVNSLRVDQDGTLWAATEGGLSRLKDGRMATLTVKNGLPCDSVNWLMEDDAHSLWLNMPCGLVRVAGSELDAWAADKDPKRTLQLTVFDLSDGVRSRAFPSGYTPQVTRSSDGKLWFATLDGVGVIDPHHLPFNKLPPPVHIEQIIADRKTYDVASDADGSVRLPPRIRDLQIDYTALSLVAPEKVLFRYKLEGWDRDWQDVGTRRQAFYANLPPRNYTFRVKACNNSGVWNEAGASLNFFVAPAYYQTTWFRTLCVAAFLTLLWCGYQLRVQQLRRQFNIGLEARVSERTRIARDLHDTLLQSFQGVLLKFRAVSYMMKDRPDEAEKTLEAAIDQASEAIAEGRDAVQGLRSSTLAGNELARAITMLGKELAADQVGNHCPDFRVHVEGTTRDLAPILRDDTYRIVGEAVRNAFRHAQARRIEVEIQYGHRELRLQVRDDGKGIDPSVLSAGARAGHYGLPGMQERVKVVGGKLAVWSELGSGTSVEVIIPGSVAYAKTSPSKGR